MDDILLLDAVEHYINGTLSESDLNHFEHLRQTNADVDQMVVEHIFFLKQMGKHAERKTLKNNFEQLHTQLVQTGEINTTNSARVLPFFTKYKKQLAVAATIIALFTVTSMALIFAYNKSKTNNDFTALNNKVNAVNSKIDKVDKKVETAEKNKRPSVVASITGTSFAVNETGYLVTNNHVLGNNKNLYVYNDKYGDLTAEVILQDEANDLAIIKITDTAFATGKKMPYTIKNTEIGLGQKVYTLGYSRGSSLVYNEGFISSKAANGSLQNKQNFLLTLQVDGGSSGSPVINTNGDIIGIISAKETQENGFAVGIKPQMLRNIINTLNSSLSLNTTTHKQSIATLTRDEQVKRIQDCIFMVKIK